ncbi:MAG: hypothetical protein ACLPPF_10340 [Rhodomicrobium sp.]
MERREHLSVAATLSVAGLVLLIAAAALSAISGGAASQERFEVFIDPAQYTAALKEAGHYLRLMLAVDDVYILAYVGALCFAALGFRVENPAAALAAGLGAIVLGSLDFWENITMGTSLDMAMAGQAVDAGRIAYQAAISAAKWNAAAATLVALSFTIPKERFFEILLVWATRLVFPAATALFVTGALDLRQPGLYAIYAGMLSGFVLLAIVTYDRSRDGLR